VFFLLGWVEDPAAEAEENTPGFAETPARVVDELAS
jgi:hypothetical protein